MIKYKVISKRPKISHALPKKLSTYLKTKLNSGLENEKSRTYYNDDMEVDLYVLRF